MEVDLPIINSEDVLLRVNQFTFIQEDIRPIPEDSAWGLAVFHFCSTAKKRITDLMKSAGQKVDIYPFRVRFMATVDCMKIVMAYEPCEDITSQWYFQEILLKAMNKFREKLASLDEATASMVYNIRITLQTIEFLYVKEQVVKL